MDRSDGGPPVDAPPDTYDRIAESFAATRDHPWPAVERFVAGRPPGVLGVDVGCGNARHATLLADRATRVVGVDASPGMLATARDRVVGADIELVLGAAASLPIRSNAADIALSVAVVHHLGPRTRRRAALDELARVLDPDGAGLVSVWSVSHDRFDATTAIDTTVDWTLPGGEVVPRYYHIYDGTEFRADLAASGLRVEETFEEAGNWYAVVAGGE